MWKTGPATYDGDVKAALGLQKTDQIIGLMYLGTPVSTPPPRGLKPAEFMIRL